MSTETQALYALCHPEFHPLMHIDQEPVDLRDFYYWLLSSAQFEGEQQEQGDADPKKSEPQDCRRESQESENNHHPLTVWCNEFVTALKPSSTGVEVPLRLGNTQCGLEIQWEYDGRQVLMRLLDRNANTIVSLSLKKEENDAVEQGLMEIVSLYQEPCHANNGQDNLLREQWLSHYAQERALSQEQTASLWTLTAQEHDFGRQEVKNQSWGVKRCHPLFERKSTAQLKRAQSSLTEKGKHVWRCTKRKGKALLYTAQEHGQFSVQCWPQEKPNQESVAINDYVFGNEVRYIEEGFKGIMPQEERALRLKDLAEAVIVSPQSPALLSLEPERRRELWDQVQNAFWKGDGLVFVQWKGEVQLWMEQTMWSQELIDQAQSLLQRYELGEELVRDAQRGRAQEQLTSSERIRPRKL